SGCSGLINQPRTGSSVFAFGFTGTAAHELRFSVSSAFAASCAVVINIGSLFTVAEYQNGFDGASGDGRSSVATFRDNVERPSINSRTCSNSDHPISSSVVPRVISRRVSSHRDPSFVADSTAALKGIEQDETNADSSAVPTT